MARRPVMLGLFRRGIFLNPMGTKFYLSIAHNQVAGHCFLDRFNDALAEIGRPRSPSDIAR